MGRRALNSYLKYGYIPLEMCIRDRGIPSIWKRDKGYEEHKWLFCLLENFEIGRAHV